MSIHTTRMIQQEPSNRRCHGAHGLASSDDSGPSSSLEVNEHSRSNERPDCFNARYRLMEDRLTSRASDHTSHLRTWAVTLQSISAMCYGPRGRAIMLQPNVTSRRATFTSSSKSFFETLAPRHPIQVPAHTHGMWCPVLIEILYGATRLCS